LVVLVEDFNPEKAFHRRMSTLSVEEGIVEHEEKYEEMNLLHDSCLRQEAQVARSSQSASLSPSIKRAYSRAGTGASGVTFPRMQEIIR
ncbi:unnamed protein product, partial [Choristocarpus tenellus]